MRKILPKYHVVKGTRLLLLFMEDFIHGDLMNMGSLDVRQM
jgi:hypothetical protein